MSFLSRNSRRNTLVSLLALGIGFIFAVGASAAPPVGILGDVTVQNDDSNPVPVVVQPGGTVRTPINITESFTIATGGSVSSKEIFTVPADKFLVIEYVSFRAFGGLNLLSDVRVAFRITTTAGGERVDHKISPVPLVSTEIPEQEGGHLVKLYADPGSIVTALPQRGCCDSTNTAVVLYVSGYLAEQL